MIAANHVQAKIEARGGAGGSENLSVVDVKNIWIDVNQGIAPRELGGAEPVRGGAESVENAAFSEREGAGANGRNACASTSGTSQCAQQRGRRRHGDVG